jgi:hypothetical protein
MEAMVSGKKIIDGRLYFNGKRVYSTKIDGVDVFSFEPIGPASCGEITRKVINEVLGEPTIHWERLCYTDPVPVPAIVDVGDEDA